jgi:hypothetical protein
MDPQKEKEPEPVLPQRENSLNPNDFIIVNKPEKGLSLVVSRYSQ